MVENLENEIWRPVVGYEGKYEVSNMGRVKSLNYCRTGKTKLLSLISTKCGYVFVGLNKNDKGKHFLVHRLVYEAFVGKLPKFDCHQKGNQRMEVNHINEIKTDNRVENLELITCTENNNYGNHKARVSKANSRKIYQYTTNGIFVKEWNSIKECQNYGFNPGAIGACCRNEYCRHERNDYKGYIWSYEPLNQKVDV